MPELMPAIDDDYPVPSQNSLHFKDMSLSEEVEMRERTASLLKTLQVHDPSKENQIRVVDGMTIASLAESVAAFSEPVVEDLATLKTYVTNKLLQEVEIGRDSKSRINALRLLGSVDGVDAFKQRSEMTVTHRTLEEVEKDLRTVLENVEFKTVSTEKMIERARESDESAT
jgi:hypothetical protein